MSVLIKGFTKPKSCDFCPATIPHLKCGFDLDHCPITEVPPHGRLIDADALTDCLATLLQFPSNLVNGQWIVNTIREQPTIIPAEEGDRT